MRQRLYNRMSILTLDVIAEVAMRPVIWTTAAPPQSNRAEKTEAWLSVVHALVEGYDEMDVLVQNEILKDVQGRWRSAKDYFLKGVKKWERSGHLPNEFNKIPYHTELHFLMPSRCLGLTNGNYGWPQGVGAQAADEEMVAGPSSSYMKEEEFEEIVVVVSSPTPSAPSSPPAAATTSADTKPTPSASGVFRPNFAPHLPPSSPTRPPPARRRRRALCITDRKREVESPAQSFMQRVDGNDDSAHFGYEMGSLCRQIPLIRRQHFKAYCQVVAAAFVSTDPLPPIEDMIMQFQSFSGQRPPPPPPANPNNVATQTDPPELPSIFPQ